MLAISVIICTWNRAGLLDETLTSLAAADVPPDLHWEVVVVDNNSTDDTRAVVERRARDFPAALRYLFEPRQGKSWAMNTGLASSRFPIVAFADDDVRVSPRWLTAIASAFREDPEIAYVGGPVDPLWEAPCPPWFAEAGKVLWGTIAILDYGKSKRVFIATNHNHKFGPEHQHSFIQWEGLNGAARISMGVNLDYPAGKPDTAEYAERGSDSPRWRSVPVTGNNFPDAFMGTMGALQCFAEGSVSTLPSHFEDAFQTMALVEALYRSSDLPGEPIPLDE